jgi:hypothetical protein
LQRSRFYQARAGHDAKSSLRLVQHGGRLVTGWFRDFLEKEKPVAKFEEKDISPYFWPQGKEPDSEEYRSHLA